MTILEGRHRVPDWTDVGLAIVAMVAVGAVLSVLVLVTWLMGGAR